MPGPITVSITSRLIAVLAVVIVVAAGSALATFDYVTRQNDFCGTSCHAMEEAWTTWQADPHSAGNNDAGVEASCVDCHFAPGGKRSLRAQMRGLRHLAAYLYDAAAPLPIRAETADAGCLRGGCHARDELAARELEFAGKARFRHEPHLGEKALAGNAVSCDACHAKVSSARHFEVVAEICFVCHFTANGSKTAAADPARGDLVRVSLPAGDLDVDFLEGPSRCELCHAIPDEPLQSQKSAGAADENDKVITHRTLREDGVPCASCHYGIVHGAGRVNRGNVLSDGCLACHRQDAKTMAKAADGALMHAKHVPGGRAVCFECHERVEHGRPADHYDVARQACTTCHDADQHRDQKLLLTGAPIVDGLSGVRGLMDAVNTNCAGCHLEQKTARGHAVRTGSAQACADCHTESQADMVEDWKRSVRREIEATREMADEARAALEAAQGGLDASRLEAARAVFAEAERVLAVVENGNGVHNKKYSMLLLDEAFVRLEELVESLRTGG